MTDDKQPEDKQPTAAEQPEGKKTNVGNDESKRWRGGKGESVRIEERVNATYAEILNGGTRRQITDRIASRFGVSVRTANEDYRKAMKLLKEEQIATRSDLLNQIQALRLAGARKALAKGQLQTFGMLLKDMGAVIQEVEPLNSADSAPRLTISVESPGANNKKAPEESGA
nr:hypothetical protein 39 [bacterium]